MASRRVLGDSGAVFHKRYEAAEIFRRRQKAHLDAGAGQDGDSAGGAVRLKHPEAAQALHTGCGKTVAYS